MKGFAFVNWFPRLRNKARRFLSQLRFYANFAGLIQDAETRSGCPYKLPRWAEPIIKVLFFKGFAASHFVLALAAIDKSGNRPMCLRRH